MFCNFNFLENHKIDNNSTTTKLEKKASTDLDSLKFLINFDVCLPKFKTTKSYLIKLATVFYQQPNYLLGEKTSLSGEKEADMLEFSSILNY
jgi:hypothetical protein